MKIADMSDDEFRAYIRESGRRVGQIAEAEGHPFTVQAMRDGWWKMTDMETGKEWFGKG